MRFVLRIAALRKKFVLRKKEAVDRQPDVRSAVERWARLVCVMHDPEPKTPSLPD